MAITLTLTANTAMVVPGQVVTLTTTLTNTGTSTLATVDVTLEVPSGLTVLSSQAESGRVAAGNTTWRSAALAAGGSAAWTVTAAVGTRVRAGTVLDVRAVAAGQSAAVSLGLPPARLPRVGANIFDFGF
jgi:uncharacterized repeat protein (TIGR01451 family)